MMRTVLASAALVASAYAQNCGSAIVINSCSYDVYLANTPSAGGGFSAIDQTLSSGGQYTQQYTELSNGNGWSIKLSKNEGEFESDVMQYEYTFHNDGTIWYDLSEVNGNPWDGNWEITATNGCTPRQAAYQYSTDDAYGMQSCSDTASITVELCSGDSAGGSTPSQSSPSSSWGSTGNSSPAQSPAQTPAQSPSPSTAPAATSTADKQYSGFNGPPGGNTWGFGEKVASPADVEPSTLATSPTSAAWNGPAVTVTNVHVETATAYVTATAAAKRHVHHPRRAHHRL